MSLIDFNAFDELCFIDDDPSFIFLNKAILKYTYPHIIPVAFFDVHKAYEYLSEHTHKTRLIFLDLNLGPYTGFDLLDMLQGTSIPNLTVVMHTTCDDEADVAKAFSYDFVKAYILKPLTIEIIEQITGKVPPVPQSEKHWEIRFKP